MFIKVVRSPRLFRPRLERLEDRCLLSGGLALPSAYGQIPLSFQVNQGQTNAQVDYLANGQGYGIFLSKTDAVLSMTNAKSGGNAIRMHLVGDNSAGAAIGLDKQSSVNNYFIGNHPSQWHTGIANYRQVEYQNVYPGIDVVYFGNQQQLEYDFVISPGANPNLIRLDFLGADSIGLDAKGDLVLQTDLGDVLQHAPVVYQVVGGVRQTVAGRFVLANQGEVGFQVGAYNASLPLTIDPILSYSTYLGGNNDQEGDGIAVDTSGDAYVTGLTMSTNFPTTTGAFQTNLSGSRDAFVTKLNATGTAILYSTYVGGNSDAIANGIAVDNSGNAYIVGQTTSTNFPTTSGAFQTNFEVSIYDVNIFVTKLNATGTTLSYSTFLGDGGTGVGIAVDSSGNAYVTGQADSSDFPTTAGAFQTGLNGGGVYVTKLNATGTGLIYSTFLGGGTGNAITVDASGDAYVTGTTASSNFPTTTDAFQTSLIGVSVSFVTKLNPTGTAPIYSTFLGLNDDFSANDFVNASAIAVDDSGDAYVTGYTDSTYFPTTTGAFQATFQGTNQDAFVTKLNSSGTALCYSTYLGGDGSTVGGGIAVDDSGDTYVAGSTSSYNFPTTPDAFQPSFNGSEYEAFLTKLNTTGTGLSYSTYFGGGFYGGGIALDGSGNVYITGRTSAYFDGFVAKFFFAPPTVAAVSPSTGPTTGGTTVTITGTGFTSASTVQFGANPAPSFTVNSDTSITAVDPAGAGTVDVTVTTPNGPSATSSADQFSYTTFQVSSTTLLSGDNGFLVTFNASYNISQLNLYTGNSGGTLGPPSVQITGPNDATFGTSAPDTLRFNAVPVDNMQLELILTGINHTEAAKVLAPGTYTITLDGGSSDPAFRQLADGTYLDGSGSGTITPVDNYTTTVSVSAIPASTDLVSIGDLVGGPGQTVAVPLVLSGGTGSVSDTTAVSLTIAPPADGAYTVTAFTVNNLTIPGVSANFNPATGLLTINSATPFATNDNPLLLGTFAFTVAGLGNPGTAPGIDTKTPINITVNSVLNDASNLKPFIGVNGFHVATYLGNLSAPVGVYNSTDVSQLQGFILSTVKAFALYRDVDPMLLADVNKDGSVNSSDVSQLQARILGLPSTIPALPLGASEVAVNGADPVLFVGTSYAPNGQPANLGSLTPGSPVLVPLSVFVTDRHGVNVTGAEVAFSFDPKVFTFNGVSAGAIADGNLGGSPFSIAFAEVAPGEVDVIGSSGFGPNLVYGRTATLFLMSLTVRADAPAAATVFNLMSSEGGFQTGLKDNLGRNLVLSPAPENLAGDNLDGAFTVQSGKPVQLLGGGLVGTTATRVKQTGSVKALAPAAWEQLATLLFEAAVNQSVLNVANCGLAVAATVPETSAADQNQGDLVEAIQATPWEKLTTVLFETAAKENEMVILR